MSRYDIRVRHQTYLLQFVCDHGESSEDTVCGAGDGDDPLRAGTLGDVDTSAALWGIGSSSSSALAAFCGIYAYE